MWRNMEINFDYCEVLQILSILYMTVQASQVEVASDSDFMVFLYSYVFFLYLLLLLLLFVDF